MRESEQARTAAEAEATLGRYMSEMRTTVNNALTSVLGNAELLLLEPGLPAAVLAQADTPKRRAEALFQLGTLALAGSPTAARDNMDHRRTAALG